MDNLPHMGQPPYWERTRYRIIFPYNIRKQQYRQRSEEGKTRAQDAEKVGLLARSTPVATSHTRPESSKIASSR